MTPTDEQNEITKAAQTTDENLIVSALAGAAKTSTLVLIAEALPDIEMLCLAFNKKIATEMQERLPANCKAMTLNSLGHRAWGDAIGRRLSLNTRKNGDILKSLIDKLDRRRQEEAYENYGEIVRAIAASKTCGYVPDSWPERSKRLMDDAEFFAWMDERPTALMEDLVARAAHESLKQAFSGTIDFDDQILMPTVFSASFPRYPLVLIDEAQDLSALNHAMLAKIARRRLIAVGDRCQAIYGFRGAHENSMDLLEQQFDMRPLYLTISFRCPRAIVNSVKWRAPMMKYPEWAKEGLVKELKEWSVDDLPEDAVVICRNNAPLFYLALRLLREGRYATILGNDISKFLIKILKSLGKDDTPREKALEALSIWKAEKLDKSRDPGKVNDQAACLKVFLDHAPDVGGAIAYAEKLFRMQGPITLMTGHKSKGLEFNNVFILDRDLLRLDHQQEQNLAYVMATRSKENLTYITTAGMLIEDDEDAKA